MSDTIYICRSAAGQFTKLRQKIGLLALAIVCVAPVDVGGRESKDWIVLENCRLISNPANDGDSFHASAGAREYIFACIWLMRPKRMQWILGAWLSKRNTLQSLCPRRSKLVWRLR